LHIYVVESTNSSAQTNMLLMTTDKS